MSVSPNRLESARLPESFDDRRLPVMQSAETTLPVSYNHQLYPFAEQARSAAKMGDMMVQGWANMGLAMLDGSRALGVPTAFTEGSRRLINALTTSSERSARDYQKPEFGLTDTLIDGRKISVHEEVVARQDHAFGRLLHFERETDRHDPPVLIVAPLSGHYATLIRDTVRQLLPHHNVYITDWKNARDVPLDEGDFGLDDYIEYVQGFIQKLGPDCNVLAICQSTVPVLAAIADLARQDPGSQPNSMTLMAGPLDTRIAPTAVNDFANKPEHTMQWFRDNVMAKVPAGYPGAGRLVYPGFMQLASFLGMNLDQHTNKQMDLFRHVARGNDAEADKIKTFYDEYLAVLDLDGPFYLETVEKVFKSQQLADGTLEYHGRPIRVAAITKTALMTVEGAKDDICAPGQAIVAHGWLTGLEPRQKKHYLQADAGHFGVFSGRKWQEQIAPRFAHFIREAAFGQGQIYDSIPAETSVIEPALWSPQATL
ncbi:MAG: polyhydroxyalkanoate depolymerase [Candidatus Saccharibacteria bacterium]